MAFVFERFATLPSTNAEAIARARAGAPEGLVIVAAAQTAGVGKGGRTWVSAPGNFYGSLLLRPQTSPEKAQQLVYVAALSVAQALEKMGAHPQLKWPNDVMLSGKKLGGILLESGLRAGQLDYLVVGIGLNLSQAPEGLDQQTTCLAAHCSGVDLANVESQVLEAFQKNYSLWQKGYWSLIREDWLARAYGLGEKVVARTALGEISGVMKGINPAGDLLLEAGGAIQEVKTADLFLCY